MKDRLHNSGQFVEFDLILLDLQKGQNLIQSVGDEPLHMMIWADMYGSGMVKLKEKYIQSDHE